MRNEILEVQKFANATMRSADAGLVSDASAPSMTTPALVTAAQFVVQGSTICLIC